MEEADGRITGYTGVLDGLTPAAIELRRQGGDLLLDAPDCGRLLLFKREV